MDPAAKNPTLLAGKADALLTYTLMGPILRQMAAGLGKELLILPWSDFGYDVTGDNIASSDTVIREKPELTRRFLRALLKGHAWGIDHPKEASESMVRVNPMAKRDIEEAQWKVVIDHMRSPFVARHGLGYHDEERVRLTRDTIFRLYEIKAQVPLKDIYTNAYLPSSPHRPSGHEVRRGDPEGAAHSDSQSDEVGRGARRKGGFRGGDGACPPLGFL